MAPPSEVHSVPAPVPSSLPGLKYPASRDDHLNKSSRRWLDDRRYDDGAEGLWRVHDTLYDLSEFVDRHPGGAQWLELTKGTDITEAFEAHHISPVPGNMLEKFAVRPAVKPRNSPYTFHPDGFYAKLRRRVFAVLPEARDRSPGLHTKLIADLFVFSVFSIAMLAASVQSKYLAALSGLFLGMSTVAAHNFFHMRDNFRRYYFDLSLMSSTSWRISHVLSHHLFPNTVTDIEISLAEPWLYWLPRKDKTLSQRYVSWLFSPLIYSLIFTIEGTRRILLHGVHRHDLIPLILPAAMLLCAPPGHVFATLLLWFLVVLSGSFYFGVVGFNAAHHHPELFHDGDTPRDDLDWGLAQLDTVRERSVVSGIQTSWEVGKDGTPVVHIDNTQSFSMWTLFKVMISFGHHSLHHLFPTIDHFHLSKLYPALAETLTEFHIPFQTSSIGELVSGQFRQLARIKPNPVAPSYLPQNK